ncbi:MAG: aromatic compound catabolic protein [Burkholderia sp.]|jgi:uncharacterized protein (TIGR00369 family)|nr:aromatic compound catabolic protein [Burkholderia sp.]
MEAQEVLASWQQQEDALYAGRPESDRRYGVASLEQVAGKSGLEIMRALLAGELPAPPISGTMDFTLIEVDHGRAVFQGRPLERHYNPLGSVHGGWFATLLDSALGCSVHTALPAGKSYTTLELKVNMLRALNSKVGLVRAEGRVIHVGGQVATAEARLVDAAGKLYAHATTTCLVFDFPQKRAA